MSRSLLPEPAPTLLPGLPEVDAMLAAGTPAAQIAARFPASSLAWAGLAEAAFAADNTMEAYAYARTGYHRGLDSLRRSGWKGFGPVPWTHEPNRGFLRCLAVLARAADRIDEDEEAHRCREFLHECDPTADQLLG
ncbi:MAG: DUF3151 domain-containing protein [Geodermatophilaceae bacterium]|nr:DUF3151 domain-containing protein [Geodermatophilaceae bacterium]